MVHFSYRKKRWELTIKNAFCRFHKWSVWWLTRPLKSILRASKGCHHLPRFLLWCYPSSTKVGCFYEPGMKHHPPWMLTHSCLKIVFIGKKCQQKTDHKIYQYDYPYLAANNDENPNSKSTVSVLDRYFFPIITYSRQLCAS